MGETGELVIGGVGLARYLDADKDAEKFAPLPVARLGRAPTAAATWSAPSAEGLLFLGRGDEQVKLGGRRIELGEVDAALQALPGVAGAAAAVQRTAAGNQLLVGYVVPRRGRASTTDAAALRLREQLPAALVPLLAVVDDAADPYLRQGGPGRAALAAAPAGVRPVAADRADRDRGLARRAAGRRSSACPVDRPDADFFSTAAAA